MTRQFSLIDQILIEFDHALRTIHVPVTHTYRPYPAQGIKEAELTSVEQELAGRLMRVNHTGEISAQGLYRGQAFVSPTIETRQHLLVAAQEEADHLHWCQLRLTVLGNRPSYLSAFWYWGSFAIGASNGLLGDKWSLGFVKETEDQVIRHIDSHLGKLPSKDLADIAVLKQMRMEEEQHGQAAMQAGGKKLPLPARLLLMPFLSKVMTKTSYYL